MYEPRKMPIHLVKQAVDQEVDLSTSAAKTLVDWRCDKGHIWEASLGRRLKGSNCPFCAGQRTIVGVNDLRTLRPEFLPEWDYSKNSRTPEQVMSGSSYKAWWLCSLNHSYTAVVSSRTGKSGTGCPYCANKKVLAGFNDLATTHPDIAKDFDKESNSFLSSEVTSGSDKYITWRCKAGHVVVNQVKNRLKSKGCGICAGTVVLEGFNDLLTLYPNIAASWHPTKNLTPAPVGVAPHENKKRWWICDLGHEWETTPSSRTSGNNCPFCSNRFVLAGFNDLATVSPALALEWDYQLNETTPQQTTGHNNKKFWWKCQKQNHSYMASPGNRAMGKGCSYCASANAKPLKGFNDLATLNPALASRWDNSKNTITSSEVTLGSGYKAWWICKVGHSYQSSISEQNFAKNGICYYCSGTETLRGFNDLSSQYPDTAKWFDASKNGYEADKIYMHSRKNLWWKCDLGHEWHREVSEQVRNGLCPICNGQVAVEGFNDLFTESDLARKMWHPTRNIINPLELRPGSSKVVWWICKEGHEFKSSVARFVVVRSKSPNVTNHARTENDPSGCPFCSNQKVLTGFNDLLTTHPLIAKRWHPTKNGIASDSVIAGSNIKRWWKCEFGHDYEKNLAQR